MIRKFQAANGFIVPLLSKKIYEFTPEFNVLFGQNGCLAEGTLVATPTGPVAIQNLKIGDDVYDENGNIIKVVNVIDQGIKEVFPLISRRNTIVEATKDHIWFAKKRKEKEFTNIKLEDFGKETCIKSVELSPPMGSKKEKHAYVIGALLGDGCSVQRTNQIHISGQDEEIIRKLSRILDAPYRRLHLSNCTWELIVDDHFDHYVDWCRGKKAHQKIVDIEEIKTWDRDSLLEFLAGLIDTDGSSFIEEKSPTSIAFNITMQALPVLEAVKYIIQALFGIDLKIGEDERKGDMKYVNGPCYYIRCRDHYKSLRILQEIGDRIQVTRKHYKYFENLPERKRKKLDYVTVTVGKEGRMTRVWDITVDSPTSLYCLANGLVTHNCGKSSMLNTLKAYMGIQKGGWTQINDPRTHGASTQAHFPFAYTAYTPMPQQIHAFVDRDRNPAFYFHGDTKIDLNFFWDTSRQSENGILSGMDNLELAAKKPSSGMLKIELINRIMNMLQTPPNLNAVPEWIAESSKGVAQMEINYINSLPNYGKITLLFDEPETALSVPKQKQLFDTLAVLSKTFQIIIATHSPLVLFRNDVNLIELTEGYAQECRDIYKSVVKSKSKA